VSIVAVVGSRKGVEEERVRGWMRTLHAAEPEDVIVSGGAEGVDTWAESEWLSLGGKVVSFRPVQLRLERGEAIWGVQRWDLGIEVPTVATLHGHMEWKTKDGALWYRNLLIAEVADKGVAFHYKNSPGTSHAIDAFASENKKLYVFKEG
jgi:hypothetical protein